MARMNLLINLRGLRELLIGSALLLGGIYCAMFYRDRSFQSASIVARIPIGTRTLCLLHAGQRIGEGTATVTYQQGAQLRADATIQLVINQQPLTAQLHAEGTTNALDQLINASVILNYQNTTLTFSAERPSPITVTGTFKSPSQQVSHSLSIQGPLFLKPAQDELLVSFSQASIAENILAQLPITATFEPRCAEQPSQPFSIETSKLSNFFSGRL